MSKAEERRLGSGLNSMSMNCQEIMESISRSPGWSATPSRRRCARHCRAAPCAGPRAGRCARAARSAPVPRSYRRWHAGRRTRHPASRWRCRTRSANRRRRRRTDHGLRWSPASRADSASAPAARRGRACSTDFQSRRCSRPGRGHRRLGWKPGPARRAARSHWRRHPPPVPATGRGIRGT